MNVRLTCMSNRRVLEIGMSAESTWPISMTSPVRIRRVARSTLSGNTLDGFNLQPRLSIPFSGPIVVSTVSSRTVFFVRLGHSGDPVGIHQILLDRVAHALHAECVE